MTQDPREGNARYYDLDEDPLGDVPFYFGFVTPQTSVLELGCGTGRVLIPLASKCREISGVDYSAGMIQRCLEKIQAAGAKNAQARVGNICAIELGRRFDLIIAPYRVLQALESPAEVDGFFETIRKHLAPGGECILNVFMPNKPREELIATWEKPVETEMWFKDMPDGTRIVASEKRARIDPVNLVLYPELIYRTFDRGALVDQYILKIKMKCYYPEEFEKLVASRGFKINGRWGGYEGEEFGRGNELVLKFAEL